MSTGAPTYPHLPPQLSTSICTDTPLSKDLLSSRGDCTDGVYERSRTREHWTRQPVAETALADGRSRRRSLTSRSCPPARARNQTAPQAHQRSPYGRFIAERTTVRWSAGPARRTRFRPRCRRGNGSDLRDATPQRADRRCASRGQHARLPGYHVSGPFTDPSPMPERRRACPWRLAAAQPDSDPPTREIRLAGHHSAGTDRKGSFLARRQWASGPPVVGRRCLAHRRTACRP